MIIPHDQLPSDILRNLARDFVLREGTDYGAHDFSLAEKVEQVLSQIREGKVYISFDPETESCDLRTR
ncbi:MAG: YheU family protein [bacterium]|nr:YheU family protein [bacterium]